MNPYALPSIIAVVPNLILAVSVLLLNPRDRTTRWLGFFSLGLGCSAAVIAGLHLSTTREEATFFNRCPYAALMPTFFAIMEYACECSGRSERLQERLLGIPIAVHRWVAAAVLIFAWVAALCTDWVLAPPVYDERTGWEHGYGPAFPVFVLVATYVLGIICYVLWRGAKAADTPAQRRLRRLSLVALAGGLGGGAALGFAFPGLLGWPTHSFAMVPALGASILLTYAQMRFQFETIDEFSRQLERKVDARTAELAEANLNLLRAKEVAEEANRSKSAFLNTVSHELRTPLTSVLGFAKLIKKRLAEVIVPAVAGRDATVERASRQVSDNVDIIVAEGERLTTLINDVLDLAKIESGKFEWHMKSLPVGEIIARAISATTSLSAAKQLEVHSEIDAALPAIVGDQDRLIQVMINLLSNAIKFTDRGAITCRARRNDGVVEVAVIDTGAGIAPEDQDKVFEQFVQVGDTLTGKPQGTGLGLPICKQIVEHHGGRIWVESVVEQGSTFAFTLPIARSVG